MNWYKKAILVDKKYPGENMSINTTCAYCGRWVTHPSQLNPKKQSEYVWKKQDKLDGEERVEMEKAKLSKNWISHGICPYCMSVIDSMNRWPEKQDNEWIKEQSLKLD